METGRASRTAEHNALFRALEATRPATERLVDDPLASAFLCRRYRAVVRAAAVGPIRAGITGLIDRRWPGVRTAVVARTRLIDDTVADLVGSTEQMVVLGAGFDTRAWRLSCLRGTRVVEVDHPDTQRAKQAALGRAAGGRPGVGASVRFVPIDFRLDGLARVMGEAGYDPSSPTLVLWEGTTNYLTADAVDATLRWCAGAAPGSQLVFTYIDRDVFANPGAYPGADKVMATLRRAGEPMTFGLVPRETGEYLAARGLELVADVGVADVRARYYGAAAAGMRGHEFYRVAHACVPAGP